MTAVLRTGWPGCTGRRRIPPDYNPTVMVIGSALSTGAMQKPSPDEPSAATEQSRPAIDDEDVFAFTFEDEPAAALNELVNQLLQDGRDTTDQVYSIRRYKAIRFIFDRMIDSTPFIKRIETEAIIRFNDSKDG